MSLDVLTVFMLLAKLCLYVGALISIGLIAHALLKIRYDLKGLTWGIGLLILGLAGKLLAANAQMTDGLSEVLNFERFHWVWQSSRSQTGFILLAILLSLTSFFMKSHRLKNVVLLAGIFCLSASFAMTGHSRGQEDTPVLYLWMIPHLLIAGFWVMAPISLWPDRDVDTQILIQKVECFSRAAIWMVPMLLFTGSYVLWQLLPQNSDLWTTVYGQLLSVKLLVVISLLGLGAWNKFFVTRTLKNDADMGRVYLRRSLSLEAILFAIIILVILFATTVTGPGDHSH